LFVVPASAALYICPDGGTARSSDQHVCLSSGGRREEGVLLLLLLLLGR